MRLLVTLVAATLLVSGCGGSNDEAGSVSETTVSAAATGETESQPGSVETVTETVTDTVTDETDAHDSGGFTGAFADTHEASRQICGGSGVVVIAKEVGTAPERDAAARAYANTLSNEGSRHHDAAYSGCLKGLSEHE